MPLSISAQLTDTARAVTVGISWSSGPAGTPGWSCGTTCPAGVEAVARGEYQFLISHLDRPVEIGLGAKRLDLLTGGMVGPRAVLAPRDALVLRRAPDRPA